MKAIWVNKTYSFKKAEEFDMEYYFNMPVSKRMDTMQLLRELHYKIHNRKENESGKRLRRVIKII